jgi:LacI family transcriptional regulator
LKRPVPIIVHLRWNFQFAQDVIAGLMACRSRHDFDIIVVNGDQPLRKREIEGLKPCGVIGDSHYRKTVEACTHGKIPFIDLTGSGEMAGLHSVLPDDERIGKLAADYLREAGFVHFAFVGYSDQAYSQRRKSAFVNALGIHNLPVYESRLSPYLLGASEPALPEFLRSLPSPCGIFACSDLRAMSIFPAMRRTGKQVLEDIAILGVDVDFVLRRMTGNHLPSIDQAAWFQGWQAGELMGRLLDNPDMQKVLLKMPPVRVMDSESLNSRTARNPMVARFMQALENSAGKSDGLGLAMREVPLSRRSLELLTRRWLGASPLQLFHRTRMKNAIRLLLDPTLPLSEVALKTGFEYQGDFSRFIKKSVGVAPGILRQGLQSKTAQR